MEKRIYILINYFCIFSAAVGCLLAVFGFSSLEWPQSLPWSKEGAEHLFLFVSISICTFFLVLHYTKRSPILVGGLITIGLALVSGFLWPLAVALWFFLSSLILGRMTLSILAADVDNKNGAIALLMGVGIYGTLVGLLARFPVGFPVVYGAALIFPLLFGWRSFCAQVKIFSIFIVKKQSFVIWDCFLNSVILTFCLIHFSVALMPEVGFDALWQHLFVASRLSSSHQWGFDASKYVLAVIPMLGDWIFAIGYMLGGETAARLLNLGFIFLLTYLLRLIIIWAEGTESGAKWAQLIFLSTPLVFTESSSLFVESVFTSFVLAGTFSALKVCFDNKDKKDHLLNAGLFFGFALSSKAVTLVALPAVIFVMILCYRKWLSLDIKKTLFISLGLAFMLGCWPYVNAWVLTGNPIFPFYNKIFLSPLWYPVNFEASAFGKGVTWDLIYRITFQSHKYLEATAVGAPGLQWVLLFFPAVIFVLGTLRFRAISLVFIGVCTFFLSFHSTAYLRYVFPSAVILLAPIGIFIGVGGGVASPARYFVRLICGVTVFANVVFLNAGSVYPDFPLRTIFSESYRIKYISERTPVRNAVDFINQINIKKSPVAFFAPQLGAGLEADALYPDWNNIKFQGEISRIKVPSNFMDLMLGYGANFVILDNAWEGVGCCADGVKKRLLIESVTDQIASFGPISVRRLREANPSGEAHPELFENPKFSSLNGWVLAGGVRRSTSGDSILVGSGANASQGVMVFPKKKYTNSVVARCNNVGSLGRLQFNWLDQNNIFTNSMIWTFNCTKDWVEHKNEVIAPINAYGAVVYVFGGDQNEIEFKSVSLY